MLFFKLTCSDQESNPDSGFCTVHNMLNKCNDTYLTHQDTVCPPEIPLELLSCKFCAKVFSSNADLHEHMLGHTSDNKIKCYKCDSYFMTYHMLATHSVSCQGNICPPVPMTPYYTPVIIETNNQFSPIRQVDGLDDDDDTLDDSTSEILQVDGVDDLALLPETPQQQPIQIARNNPKVAPYLLNQKKQVSKLAADASIDDIEIVVSPTEHNVTILCSTGFYTLVVMPTFSSVSSITSTSNAGYTISCYDITEKIDGSNASVNKVYFFRVSAKDKNISAKVTVHLHHTVRKVQVQGGALIENRIRAGVWFVENFLLKAFADISKDKAVDISKFNKAVKDMVANHTEKIRAQESCSLCDIPFRGRSMKQSCTLCNQKYHKGCYTDPDHPCVGAGPSHSSNQQPGQVPVSGLSNDNQYLLHNQAVDTPTRTPAQQEVPVVLALPPPVQLSLPPPPMTSQQDPALGNMHHEHEPVNTASTQQVLTVANDQRVTSNQSLSIPLPGSITQESQHANNYSSAPAFHLDPTVTPYIPRASNSGNAPPQSEQTNIRASNVRKSKVKSTLGTTQEEIASEYAKTEIKTLKAKLKEQELSVKDLKFQNSILLERISAIEKPRKQAIFEEYFTTNQEPADSCHGRGATCSLYRCPRACPPCPQPTTSPGIVHKLDLILQSLQDLIKILSVPRPQSEPDKAADTASSGPNSPEHGHEQHHSHSPDQPPGHPPELPPEQQPHLIDDQAEDDSIISIDENMPSISDEEHLNSKPQTSQYQILMQ